MLLGIRFQALISVETALVSHFKLSPREGLILFTITAAFALSSGTIGAALSSSLSKTRSVALSYGTVLHPTPTILHEPAHRLGAKIINHLWENWGEDAGGLRNGEVDLYNINIPMIHGLLSEENLKICWTRIWRNSYGRLFKAHISREAAASASEAMSPAGPDSSDGNSGGKSPDSAVAPSDRPISRNVGTLSFRFAPDMTNLINPPLSSLPVGSDGWAIAQGWVSVTPIRASFAEPGEECNLQSDGNVEDRVWKFKL
ncbi:uncharacterized protein FIBRA_04043 [Fibroporia radiculosa]|uniref:Survival protein SurE-like phosphatase/nucleotidase domain-containing protein n=1 Tax=Fibroporia radiculosa TaxID=599839 RepID=J4GNW2_9APHY|nr:uncharacterized protein FIBRA_04043 [Fibroporia radiculosa]CCM01970.1 predicted protein [Fibroporia radiculosa]